MSKIVTTAQKLVSNGPIICFMSMMTGEHQRIVSISTKHFLMATTSMLPKPDIISTI